MFIKRLSFTDWKSHKATIFEFGKVNLIRGANNVGKSSVAAGIEFLLTGRCSHTGASGQGGESLIRFGAKKTIVRAEIGANRELTTIERERNHAGSSVMAHYGHRNYAGRQFEEMLEKRGFGKDVLSAALRGGRFISLSPNEQKELLADVLKPEMVEIPFEILEELRKFANSERPTWSGIIGLEKIDLETARLVEADAVKMRAECTAALRELGEPEKVEERPVGSPTSAEVQKKLDSLRAEQNSIVREKEKLENAWADASKARRLLPAQIEAAKKGILSEADELKYLEAIEHEAETQQALATLQKVNLQIEDLQHQIKVANKQAGKCPTCGHEMDTEELVARLEKSFAAAKSRTPSLQQTVDRYPSVSDARNALQVYRAAIADTERLQKDLEGLGDPSDPPNTKVHQAKIEELEARIQKGQTVLSGIAAHEQRAKAYAEAIEKRASIASRREAADILAKWCGPSGIQAQMAQGKLEPFCGAINAILGRFGYDCEINLEPYSIRVGQVGRDASLRCELGSLSESEQWRFSLGFQAALAKATGLSLVVLDRADVLVGPNRGTMLKTILSCELEQVFILASVDSKAKLPDDFTVFDLALDEQGNTVVTKGE